MTKIFIPPSLNKNTYETQAYVINKGVPIQTALKAYRNQSNIFLDILPGNILNIIIEGDVTRRVN